MTCKELLANRKTRYLFTQKGFDYYECGYRFYKVDSSNPGKAIPIDIKDNEFLFKYSS
jgi:hypothetical protein